MQKINWSFGVEVSGKEGLTQQDLSSLIQQHSFVVINDMPIRDPQHFREFACQFGELFPTMDSVTVDKITRLDHWATSTKHNVDDLVSRTRIGPIKNRNGEQWHQDGAPYTNNHMLGFATMRFDWGYDPMQIVGDTLFCNSKVVYQNLSKSMKSWLRSLKVTHSSGNHRNREYFLAQLLEEHWPKKDLAEIDKGWMQINKFIAKPITVDLVSTNSAGEWLNFSPQHAPRIMEITKEESDMIVKHLVNKLDDPNLHYAHRWQPDQIVIWDNRYLVHRMLYNASHVLDRRLWRVQSLIEEKNDYTNV